MCSIEFCSENYNAFKIDFRKKNNHIWKYDHCEDEKNRSITRWFVQLVFAYVQERKREKGKEPLKLLRCIVVSKLAR